MKIVQDNHFPVVKGTTGLQKITTGYLKFY